VIGLIETENLTKKFGTLVAVDDVTLRVNDGKFSVFLDQTVLEKQPPSECFVVLYPKPAEKPG
jgi:hypothetical protein